MITQTSSGGRAHRRKLWSAPRRLLILALLTLAGCVAYSDQPLTDLGAQPIDTALIGSWSIVDQDESVYLHIGLDKDPRQLRVLMVETNKKRELGYAEFTGHNSRINGRQYLNLKSKDPADPAPGYLIMKYTVDGNALGLAFMHNKVAADAIARGKLKGETDPDDRFSAAHITESQKKLRRFVAKHDQELFGEMTYMSRVPTAVKRSETPDSGK